MGIKSSIPYQKIGRWLSWDFLLPETCRELILCHCQLMGEPNPLLEKKNKKQNLLNFSQ